MEPASPIRPQETKYDEDVPPPPTRPAPTMSRRVEDLNPVKTPPNPETSEPVGDHQIQPLSTAQQSAVTRGSQFFDAASLAAAKVLSYVNPMAYSWGWGSSVQTPTTPPAAEPIAPKPHYIQPAVAMYDEVKSNKSASAALSLMGHFTENDLKEEGIFRLPGNTTVYKQLARDLTNNPEITNLDESIGTEEKASALKQLFKEMGLFQSDTLKEKCLDFGKKLAEGKLEKDEITGEMKELINGLTPTQQQALEKLLNIFSIVISNTSTTKMTPKNIATSCQSMLDWMVPSNADMTSMSSLIKASQALIENLIIYH